MVDVDTLLGDHKTRYFGDGHKRTSYSINHDQNNQAYGTITQSGVWSNKSDKVIQPHLSTLDGIVLASLAAEGYLKEQYEVCEGFYLSQFSVKSGRKPIEDLNRVPIVVQKSSFNGDKASFTVSVLDMTVNLVFKRIDTYTAKDNKPAAEAKDYLSNHLKDIHHHIYDVNFLDALDIADKCSIFCKANKAIRHVSNYKGISSQLSNSYSLLELLIIFSQMAEMLAYYADDIDRRYSETLWMKNVSAELVEPIPDGELALLGKITKNKLLDMKGKDWKLFEMSGTDTQNRVRISSKIAHQLPSSEMLNNA
ncbi:TPA: avirulence protein [Streptococcus equi subsp. zooepidemicus]|nr:avirulence protein [Streptococcus equi subsp. zooepidemicus]HEL0604356.1 avirulence protein [Streptococcus equi subsp. zooepidemicus]